MFGCRARDRKRQTTRLPDDDRLRQLLAFDGFPDLVGFFKQDIELFGQMHKACPIACSLMALVYLVGLVVINVQTGRFCNMKDSVLRNVFVLIPGANVMAVFLESITILRDPQGQRLGDRLAQTQVIEGLGAKDLARSFERWWLGVFGNLERQVRRPRRQPAER